MKLSADEAILKYGCVAEQECPLITTAEPGGVVETSDGTQVHFMDFDVIAGGDKVGYESAAEATFDFDVRDRLAEIVVPTTIIHGDHDATVPVARAAELASGIAGASLHVLPGEGRFVNVQAPQKVNPLLANALQIPNDLVPRH
jgi:pimeloyl-ACP methyl ester carboxylesterase